MEKLVSNWYKDQSLPENYIFPPEKRPGKFSVASCNTIPVVDLSKAVDHNRFDIIQQILEAGKEFGFFQVINHGVPEKLIDDTKNVFLEFFEMPAEDKASFYSEDPSKINRLCTSSVNYHREETHYWRDNLRHLCHPSEECIQHWPTKPDRYREVVGAYTIEVKKLGSIILELISKGLGLDSGYFRGKLSEYISLSVNYYPPCPDPSLTLGIAKHCDPNIITILLQGDVSGLQVFKDEEWIAVEPLPNAFVINFGYALQIISNDKLKSADHRAVTNSKNVRMTAAFFINPTVDSIIEPARALTGAENPPIYEAFQYQEFLTNYISMDYRETVLELYKRQA
ncbi:Hyoscyamine 6-dioxygenase [Melia azedarach]|uniref:Hyoscyamine 6-dioxygenase n=1 Tax=Melia azedarach TaxID=155640 RepID=A0ACC1YUM8_MELAZ|nr:Hyoscyamine 6-dioxygenase [Melia azedarach]